MANDRNSIRTRLPAKARIKLATQSTYYQTHKCNKLFMAEWIMPITPKAEEKPR